MISFLSKNCIKRSKLFSVEFKNELRNICKITNSNITGIHVRTVEQSSQQGVPELPTSVVEHLHLPKGDETMPPAAHVGVRTSKLLLMIFSRSSKSRYHHQLLQCWSTYKLRQIAFLIF